MKGIASLNVYKKVSLVRRSTDTITFEDKQGKRQSVSDLGTAACTSNASFQPKPKIEIPVPRITESEGYGKNVPATYKMPTSYVRYQRVTADDLEDTLEYLVDAEDEVWLLNNSKFGGASKNTTEEDGTEQARPQLRLEDLEMMMDTMEKATGFETIITVNQAERAIVKKIPNLLQTFPTKARAGVVALKHVIEGAYSYWVQKRSKLKRPLLRRFWPVTASDDTNPHLVFRPREKEKYKLRKKRQNDMDAFRKMKKLRKDFEKLRVLMELVKRREKVNRMLIFAQNEQFEQQIYDMVDTSGQPRVSTINREEIKELAGIPQHFDTSSSGTSKKKRRRKNGDVDDSRSSTPISTSEIETFAVDETPVRPTIVAGQNHGEPAPNFLHPLSTRESYVTSWHNAVPFIPSYENAKPTPTSKFRYRPRIGRGGRVCIDRFPQEINSKTPSTKVFRAGHALPMVRKDRLLELLPPPIDHAAISQKVEEMCVSAIREDFEASVGAPTAAEVSGDPEENDGEEVLVKMSDWLNTDDQLWGQERFAIGPI
mmetsp:Transcript_11314/g.16621  ORF Transcript_11314/g.16621 Transcript_11314/m.16621 type:complete len:541 (-) Transcript_11314:27-1649(-)